MGKNKEQKIKCNVVNCIHNNDIEYLCTLNEIDVSCTCNKEKCKDKLKTICNSFDKRK